ncbi:hypothetical protein LJC74_04345 [Eubacteriales bacterium OttesenSCG-928-A19]|nr:hypothetical protein [Eubacteriales bacterium OttesenSCG-928-A19]
MITAKKRGLLAFLLMALLLAASAHAETPQADALPRIRFRTYELGLAAVGVNPNRIEREADGNTYYLIRLRALSTKVEIGEIAEALDSGGFYLLDSEDVRYEAKVFLPYNIVFNERNQVFLTAPQQSEFDLLFILPDTIPLESLSLCTQVDTLPLDEITLERLP